MEKKEQICFREYGNKNMLWMNFNKQFDST